jgi:tetratricopeptide (TPR) repeat protein
MTSFVRIAFAVTATVSLGGCQSFPLTSWMFKKERPRVEEHRLAGNTTGALEEGGAYLREGNLSAAVASYQIALLDRASRADASNGLGVAYAKLGRDDLAARYFLAAIDSDPDNPKYVANLLRLQQQVLLARRADEMKQGKVLAVAETTALHPRQADARPAGPRTSHLVERVSRGEIQIRTRTDLGNAPRMAVAFNRGREDHVQRGHNVSLDEERSSQGPLPISLVE